MRRRVALLVAACCAAPSAVHAQLGSPPELPREARGVWVATVNNIDWPSRPGLPVEEQKAELIRILDHASRLRLNLVIFQVRPAADALYQSAREPWSEFLTGEMGRAPAPFYDPLQFAIEEAHRRGLELHAWFNPFRARYSTARPAAPTHISQARPELVKRYAQFLWLDPGQAAAHEHSLEVMLDVVRRYDVDGIHIDDYFYPYQARDSRQRLIPFPDDESYARYRARGGRLARDDWRRSNIDGFVQELYTRVKATKPWVKVGISPFGIWRSGFPSPVVGLDAFIEIYADARKWLREGWLDYIVPQLYWPVSAPRQSYAALLEWWVEQNFKGRQVYAGNGLHRVLAGSSGWPVSEITEQIRITRAQRGATGNVFFSMASLLRNPGGLADTLAAKSYAHHALMPATIWLDRAPPPAPRVRVEPHRLLVATVAIEPDYGELPFLWVVRLRFGQSWFAEVVPARQLRYLLLRGEPARLADEVAVSAVDRNGNESTLSRVAIPR